MKIHVHALSKRQPKIHERGHAFEAKITLMNVRVRLFSESKLIVDTGLSP